MVSDSIRNLLLYVAEDVVEVVDTIAGNEKNSCNSGGCEK
jgi:hypothetical protein